MNFTNTKTLLFGILVLGTLSCKKSSTAPSKSKTELLTQAAWKIDVGGVDADKNGTIDLATNYPACQLDDTFLFKTGGSGDYNNNTLTCNTADPLTGIFTWAFNAGETVITANIPFLSVNGDVTITTLDDNTLEVYYDKDAGGGIILRYIMRLKH